MIIGDCRWKNYKEGSDAMNDSLEDKEDKQDKRRGKNMDSRGNFSL